jgi:hypothetical protein
MSAWLDLGAMPLYGLSANVAPPPFAALLSIAMLLGLDAIGMFTMRSLLPRASDRIRWLRWQAPVVGAAVLASALYPVALLGWFPRNIAAAAAMAVSLLGAAHGCKLVKFMLSPPVGLFRRSGGGTEGNLFWLITVGLGLIALGPVTDADSLDYHVGVALALLNTGTFPFSPEWFSSRLAGSGEVLIALGLSIGAEQFGSLLQYSGFLAIVGIFRHGFLTAEQSIPDPESQWRKIATLAMVSSPVFLAWVASPKPMLLPVAMTTAALILTTSLLSKDSQEIEFARPVSRFTLVCLLVMAASVMKMNFLMSGAFIGAIALGNMIRCRLGVQALTIGLVGAALIMAPPVFWKSTHYGGAPLTALLTPFPGGWPGTEAFEAMLRGYRDTQVPFPLSLVIPAGLGTITTTLGFGLLIPAIAFMANSARDRDLVTLIAAAAAVAVTGMILGQRNARFLLEPYLWLLIATITFRIPLKERLMVWISRAVSVQATLILVMIGVGIATLTAGAITVDLREKTMGRHAYGYAIMKWADGQLPPDARLIVEPRSIALAPRFAIANDWRGYVPADGVHVYSDIVTRLMPDFTLLQVAAGNLPRVSGCAEVFAGPYRTKVATRNPFNSGFEYDAWIIKHRVSSSKPCPQGESQ